MLNIGFSLHCVIPKTEEKKNTSRDDAEILKKI